MPANSETHSAHRFRNAENLSCGSSAVSQSLEAGSERFVVVPDLNENTDRHQ